MWLSNTQSAQTLKHTYKRPSVEHSIKSKALEYEEKTEINSGLNHMAASDCQEQIVKGELSWGFLVS